MEILLSKPTNKIGKAIIEAEKIADGEATYCHVAIKIGKRVYESLIFGGVSSRDYELAYRNVPHDLFDINVALMPQLNEERARVYLEGLIGKFRGLYGFSKIPLMLSDAIASFIVRKRVFWFTKTFRIKSFPICSSLVGKVLNKFGEPDLPELFKDWKGLNPDDFETIVERMI